RAQPATFVGRTAELEALRAAFARARAGAATTVHVRGDSGIGKSELARRFADEIAAHARVLAGRCYERESVPYQAIDGIIDALAHWLRDLDPAELDELLPADVALLARTFPVLDGVPAIAARGRPACATDPRALRAGMFAAFRELMARLARRYPLVL